MIRSLTLAILVSLGGMIAPVAAQQYESAEHGRLTVDLPLSELLENPGARAVLERHVSEVVADPQVSQSGQSLRAVAQSMPEMTTEKLAEIDSDLAALGGAPFFQ